MNATALVVGTPGAANVSVISVGGDGIVSVAGIVQALGPGHTASASLNSVVSVSGQLDGDFGSLGGRNSALSAPVSVIPLALPSDIRNPVMVNGDGGVGSAFDTAKLGTPILDYSALCMPGALSFTQAASPLVLLPLSNGINYDCAITARNALGSGPPVSVAVRPSVQLFGDGFE